MQLSFIEAHDGHIFACKYSQGGKMLTVTNQYGCATGPCDAKDMKRMLGTPIFKRRKHTSKRRAY